MFRFSALVLVLLLLTACSSTNEGVDSGAQVGPLNRIAVLPAVSSIQDQDSITYEQARILDQGATFLTSVMSAELAGNPKVRFVSDYGEGITIPAISGGVRNTVQKLGTKYGCDAVLITSIRRFQERVGGSMSVDTPASASFSLFLVDTRTGSTLWTGTFMETQQSLMSNLFSFGQAQTRGFTWITVEEMVAEGLKEKLAECPYL